jgi:hypothetical protein
MLQPPLATDISDPQRSPEPTGAALNTPGPPAELRSPRHNYSRTKGSGSVASLGHDRATTHELLAPQGLRTRMRASRVPPIARPLRASGEHSPASAVGAQQSSRPAEPPETVTKERLRHREGANSRRLVSPNLERPAADVRTIALPSRVLHVRRSRWRHPDRWGRSRNTVSARLSVRPACGDERDRADDLIRLRNCPSWLLLGRRRSGAVQSGDPGHELCAGGALARGVSGGGWMSACPRTACRQRQRCRTHDDPASPTVSVRQKPSFSSPVWYSRVVLHVNHSCANHAPENRKGPQMRTFSE